MKQLGIIAGSLFGMTVWAQSPPVFELIRSNEAGKLRGMMNDPTTVNARGRFKVTPLIYAAAFGSPEVFKMLLDAGADVRAVSESGVTALHYAAWDPDRVKLLLEKGADVNARTKMGRTPLLIAAGSPGAGESVRLLLAKGAEADVRDGYGSSPLLEAALTSHQTANLLLAHKADVNAANREGITVLQNAASSGDVALVKALLARGANVNAASTNGGRVKQGAIALQGLTPLMLAAPYGTPELVRTLLEAGADVNATDIRGMTPLMLAVASETQNARVVKLLLDAKADVSVKSKVGETAADWARKYGNPDVMKLLRVSRGAGSTSTIGAGPLPDSRVALQNAVNLLQRSSAEFFRQTGCSGCHHQNIIALSVVSARKAGLMADPEAVRNDGRSILVSLAAFAPGAMERFDLPGHIDTAYAGLNGLADTGMKADITVDSIVSYVAMYQRPDGSWNSGGGISRAPIEESDISRTVWSLRALQRYGWPARAKEFQERIERAQAWLKKAQPKTSYEHAERLLGLQLSGAGRDDVHAAAKALLKLQRADGGWAQNRNLDSDAYATGLALYALSEANAAPSSGVERAIEFLRKTQKADGSWHVASRAPKFQPYFQSGFPYDHDQWISAAGTAWAVTGWSNALRNGVTAELRQRQ